MFRILGKRDNLRLAALTCDTRFLSVLLEGGYGIPRHVAITSLMEKAAKFDAEEVVNRITWSMFGMTVNRQEILDVCGEGVREFIPDPTDIRDLLEKKYVHEWFHDRSVLVLWKGKKGKCELECTDNGSIEFRVVPLENVTAKRNGSKSASGPV